MASHGVSPALFNTLGYDAIKDFAPISLVGTTPNVLVVHPAVPARTLGEFVEYVKASPGKYNYGSPGYGTSSQMTTELFKLTTGLNLVHVDSLPTPVYDFDPAGWTLFVLNDERPRVGGSEYVAVNRATGKVRFLGMLGQ